MLQGFEPSISEGMMLFMINKVFQEPPEERNLGLWGWWAILLTTQLGCGIWFSFRESFHYAFVKPDVHNEVQFHLTGNINLDLVCWVTGLHQIQVIFFLPWQLPQNKKVQLFSNRDMAAKNVMPGKFTSSVTSAFLAQ